MDKNYNMGGRHHIFERPGSDIKMTGYLRKLKTMKKKFFVLRSTSSSGPARLEYYDNEKKFQSGSLPKRSIHLHTCFNINKRKDSRTGRFGIVLYTVPDSFTVLTESEADQEAWLDVMLEYQNEYLPDGDTGKEHYEHVWQVTMQPKGLGQGKGLKGQYRMCLNSTTISLFKVNAVQPQLSTQLVTVRAVGHNENNFWLQLGNYSSTGPGEFWFLVEDAAVANDMHKTIVQYMASVKDFLDKNHQFATSKKVISSGLMDSFGGISQHYGDSRKSYASSGTYPNDASLDFTADYYCMKQSNGLSDFSHPQCSSDFDGESSCYYDSSLVDHPSTLSHHSLVSTHSGGKHSYNFPEHLHPTHLPTVKEGGSGEGYLLSDLPTSETSSMDFPRPEPATCLLSDEPVDLPPRTYSCGSRPTKKFQGFPEVSSRKAAGNEISRATSAPHIPKGRKEREHKRDSPSPAPSPLSTSMKSDDSDSMIEYGPIRPRTASDSFNYRSRTSSFGKPQQNCRPRSSSYGQGKRPTINITKLKLEKAMLSGNVSQRTSRESSLQSSFESLRVSSESLRRPSLELRQPSLELRELRQPSLDLQQHPRVVYSSDQNNLRNTPSPQMKNLPSDSESFNDLGTGVHKNGHFVRTEIGTSGRPPDLMARRSDHQQHHHQQHHHQPQSHVTHEHSRVMTSGTCNDDVYTNIDFSTQSTSNHDVKPLPSAARGQHSRVETSKYMNVDLGSRNRRPNGGRSVSVENVDTYFISDLPFTVNKPRTGSVGSKDKQMLRPESARKSIPVPASSPVPSYFVPTSSVQSSAVPCSSQCINQQSLPLASMSSHSFGGNDSVRRLPGVPSSEKHRMPDFRQKSGSTGSRPITMRGSLGMASGKEHRLPSAVPMRKSSLPRFTDDDEYINFELPSSRCDSTTGCRDSSDITQPGSVVPGNTDANIIHSSMAQMGTEPIVSQFSTESRITQSGKESHITHSEISPSGTSHSYLPLVQSDETDPAASNQGVASASNPASPSSSSSPCRVTSHPPTSSAKDGESYILQEPSLALLRRYCIQKFHKAAVVASIPPHSNATGYQKEHVEFRLQIPQGQKPEHVALDHAECKLASALSGVPTSGHDAASTQYLNGYVEYEPGSVSCESLKLTPDSAFSHVNTCRGGGTVGLAKLKQHQTCLNIHTPARKSLSHKAVTDADLCHCHHNTSDDSWGTDPESLSEQTCRHCFNSIKAQSLGEINTCEHRHLNSSVEVNGLPPTGLLGPQHHVHNCDDNVSSQPCIETLSKESYPLSCSPAGGTHKCQQACIDQSSDISSAADSMSSSESFDIFTHGNTPSVVDSIKSTAISSHAKHPRHSLSDIMSITGTTSRVCENSSPGTGNISALDNLQMHRKSGFRHSLTDCDFLDMTAQLTSQN